MIINYKLTEVLALLKEEWFVYFWRKYLTYMQKILVVLGRFGDIYMTLRQMKTPCILACYPDFAQIVTELFPQHMVYPVPRTSSKESAIDLCKMKFPGAIVMSAQQHGCKLEDYVEFRNYQSYQIFYANKLQESNNIS